jgi:broad specificity phosphatase PhoE
VEQSFGAWERLGREEAQAAFPTDFQAWSSGDPSFAPTGGESLQQVAGRLRSWLDEVLLPLLPASPNGPMEGPTIPAPAKPPQSSGGGIQAVVAHGSLLQTLLCLLLRTPLNNHWPFRFHQAGWAELERGEHGFSLLSFQAPPSAHS